MSRIYRRLALRLAAAARARVLVPPPPTPWMLPPVCAHALVGAFRGRLGPGVARAGGTALETRGHVPYAGHAPDVKAAGCAARTEHVQACTSSGSALIV